MRLAFLLSAPYDPQIRQKVQDAEIPRQDYLLISDALGADLIAPVRMGVQPGGKIRSFIRRARIAWAGFKRRREYDLIISDLENVGLILALLFKLTRSRNRHVMVCHGKIISPWSIRFMKMFRISGHIDRFVCYGPRVAEILEEELPAARGRVAVVYHPADHEFWKPQGAEPERLISAAGMFFRDYATLIEAVRDLDVTLHIAGYSPWMAAKHNGNGARNVPPNVCFGAMSQPELRDLYDRSLFVALPLAEADGQAGSLVMYEAMATGKAVVASKTKGQEELGLVQEGVNGLYVNPGSSSEWRKTIIRLLENPSEAICMGYRAREIVEQGLNIDRWTEEFATVVNSVATGAGGNDR